jgi:D-alanyl-D-alanine carboxypeptidase
MQEKLRKQRAQRRILRSVAYGLIMLWALCGLVGLFAIVEWVIGKAAGKQEQAYGNELHTETVSESTESPEDSDQAVGSGQPDLTGTDPNLLVLVNKDHALSEDYDQALTSICNGRLEASERLYAILCAMLEAAGEAGYDYWIASAYRSRQRQQELVDEDVEALMQKGATYEEALSDTYRETMPAGHSEHETGLALDILCAGNTAMDISQADEPGNKWLVQHCMEYGFILRYPADKEDVTGISYEPWHFRYVGKEAAQYIMEHGIALEEF